LNLANSGGFTKVANILRAECVDGASAKALADALKAKDEKAANIAFDGCPMDTTVAPLHKGFVKNSSALSYAARQGYIDVVDELSFTVLMSTNRTLTRTTRLHSCRRATHLRIKL